MAGADTSPRGRFITFEGGEGTGKSTQANVLAARLAAAGLSVVESREPGGSPFAERVRDLLLDPTTPAHAPLAEALLFSAARADHLEATVVPALAGGKWVICDRFIDSTRAYQGVAGGLEMTTIRTLEALAVGANMPDLTFILDLPVDLAFQRVGERRKNQAATDPADPFEARGRQFHEDLRAGFRAIAEREPERCVVIDAAPDRDAVAAEIWAATTMRFPEVAD